MAKHEIHSRRRKPKSPHSQNPSAVSGAAGPGFAFPATGCGDFGADENSGGALRLGGSGGDFGLSGDIGQSGAIRLGGGGGVGDDNGVYVTPPVQLFTLIRCLFIHLVNVFFCTVSRSSETDT